ncbi:MAG: hypothetical protein RR140_01120 [Clostridia bacterium]
MNKKTKTIIKTTDITENETQNILDILLDEDNENPVTLRDENDIKYVFDQVAIITLEEKLYAILKPVTKIDGVADDEAIAFEIKENAEDDVSLEKVSSEQENIAVFDEYYKLVEKSKKSK